jgi:hypothetical protein
VLQSPIELRSFCTAVTIRSSPFADSALLSAKLVKNSTLKIYPGFPHGMCTTNPAEINEDMLAFISASGAKEESRQRTDS